MSMDEMQAMRKQRGLLHSDKPTKSKNGELQKKDKLVLKKDKGSKKIQIRFIKK